MPCEPFPTNASPFCGRDNWLRKGFCSTSWGPFHLDITLLKITSKSNLAIHPVAISYMLVPFRNYSQINVVCYANYEMIRQLRHALYANVISRDLILGWVSESVMYRWLIGHRYIVRHPVMLSWLITHVFYPIALYMSAQSCCRYSHESSTN